MARRRTNQTLKATLKTYHGKLVHTHKQGKVFRGMVEYEGVEYFYSANKHCMPMVFGAKNLEILKETARALNEWHAKQYKGRKLYENIDKLFNNPKAYLKEIDKGILIVKSKTEYMGYMPGPAGSRVVNVQLTDMKYRSCTHNKDQGWAKKVYDDSIKPFRQMASQGQRIKDEMIPEFKRVIAALEEQIKNNKPDPDGPGPNKTKEETKPEPQPDTRSEVQMEQEQQQTVVRRRRRTTTMEVNTEQPRTKKSEIVICYCGSCNCDTEQERVNASEVMCKECGSQWEYFPEETKEEIVIETVQEEMEQAMNEEMKKVEEQVKEELEQRSTRRRTNEDVHNKETKEEPVTRLYVETEDNTYQDNCSDEIPSNTNDVDNTQSNEKAINNDDYDWSYEDIEPDTYADEEGDGFDMEGDILW